MNRTLAFLVAALCLGLIALVVKVPGASAPQPVAVVTPGPAVAPPAVPVPAPVKAAPGSLTLTGRLSHPYLSPGASDLFLTLDVTAVDVPGATRAPVNMALVIDRSGSMAGYKLANAKRAARQLVDSLDERDRLAIVHYGSDVKALASLPATPENREKMKRYIDRLVDDGGTNIGAGLVTGQKQLMAYASDFKVNRLVLLSDGQPTEGIQSASGLTRLVSRMRTDGVSVTSLGIGSDFNEDLMQQFAEVGGGSYGFIRDTSVLAAIIRQDLQQAGTTVARTVTLSAKLPPGVELREVLGRPSSTSGGVVTIALPDFAARQTEKLVLHLVAQVPNTEGKSIDVADFSLDYRDTLADRAADERLQLAAMVTNDRTVAEARRDKVATVTVARAQAAVNYKKAADAIAMGKPMEAARAVQANKQIFDDASTVAGGDELKNDLYANEQTFGLVQAAPRQSREEQAESVKAMKVQGLRGSGRGASLY